jgi:hypothetical protein
MSSKFRAASSERRMALAKPNSNRARSRIFVSRSPAMGAIAMIRSTVAGVFLARAVPSERRIPRMVARTRSSSVGKGNPASLCA